MTAAPWSVKGINPKAREVAKEHARRSGMTLGEWLNRVILEDDVPDEVSSEDHFGAWPRRQALADQPLEPPRAYMADPDPRYRPAVGGSELQKLGEFGRIAVALDRLTDRIEAAETRTGLAISGVEHSVRHAMAKIEAAEREQMVTAARFDAAAERLDAEQARTTERLRRMEAETSGPRSAEALRLLEARVARVETQSGGDPAELIETVVTRLGERLSLAEGRTSDALESLRGSLAELDRRMESGGGGAREDLEQRFEALADQLTRRVEDARVEVAQRLAGLGSGGGQMEARLAEMAERLAGAEQRSAQAIDAMGREVLTMAETLNRRVQSAEQRSAQAIEQVGGEIARIAGAVESRLGRTDQMHAEALERLGSEIGRITERLTDRIIQSERRAAQAIDDVGEQVSKVTERIEQRHDRASSDLAERLRVSEARTASLLDAARQRLEGAQPTEDPGPFAASEAAPTDAEAGHEAPPAVLTETPTIFASGLMARAELLSQPALDPGNPSFAAEDFAAADDYAPIPEFGETPTASEAAIVNAAAPADPAGPAALSTRDVIDQARAAARAAAAPRPKTIAPTERRPRAARNGLFAAFRPGRPTSTWQTALMVAGGAAFLSVGAAGVVLLEGPGAHRDAPVALPSFISEPRAAVALSAPNPGSAPAEVGPSEAVDPGSAAGREFLAATRAVEQQTPGALAKLKAMAEGDLLPAQIYLARVYETGSHGVRVNPVEARRWTERAAEGGDPTAMHNLALYYFHGDGGVKDPAQAARWFRKAAERGIVDSQYNLAMLYQSGSGVPRDLAAAYTWFSIAAKGGDAPSRAGAATLEGKLTSAQIITAQAEIGGFGAAADAPEPVVAQATTPGVSPTTARKILERLGYLKGHGGDVQLAVAAYQRDQGLAASGALDSATLSRLSAFSR
jgi:localization factor PodJL